MRLFFDTEFWERPTRSGGIIDLISIGIVAEDGREFYGESDEFPWDVVEAHAAYANHPHVSDTPRWLTENVRPHLQGGDALMSPADMRAAVKNFVGDDKPQFWAWYADYDWVVLCQLMGRMVDLPKGWPMYCRDLKQVFVQLGNPRAPNFATTEHNALADALELKARFQWAQDYFNRGADGKLLNFFA